ncbi:Uncharacterised protein [uncultured archaeon]|nr:Uncharacterised protein [uncultured archaeon]
MYFAFVFTFSKSIGASSHSFAIACSSGLVIPFSVSHPATSNTPPTCSDCSRYLSIVWHPMLCPTRYVSLSGFPTVFLRYLTQCCISGASVFGIWGVITLMPCDSSSFFSQGIHPPAGLPPHPCTIMALFILQKKVFLSALLPVPAFSLSILRILGIAMRILLYDLVIWLFLRL